jgi:hypothetical protein
MNIFNPRVFSVVIVLWGGFALSGCSSPTASIDTDYPQQDPDTSSSALDLIQVEEAGRTAIEIEAITANLQVSDTGGLTAQESEGLQFMREEEKLAHDLYLELYELWGLPMFNNITKSEATHTAAVKQLLDHFGIEDPAHANVPGVFQDAVLQDLYDQLLTRSSQSLEDALLAGALVEEVDIQHLKDRIAQTDDPLIEKVYAKLIAGSKNHLRSFVTQYPSRSGQTYSSQFLDDAQVQEILASSMGRGKGRPFN